ncbi:MAG: DUF4231 domain-containing protein [Acidobacteria bacterium]|nr:DUF4231 domain-containing protein [Acidobacteriota bacterium]
MTAEEYLQQRVEDQINWYSKKSRRNKRAYHWLRVAEISAAALIPFLTGYINGQENQLKLIVGLLGLGIAIISGLLALYRFQENWLQYRTTNEVLRRERFCFLTQIAPYNTEQAFSLFVQRIESILSEENSGWARYIREEEKKPAEAQEHH